MGREERRLRERDRGGREEMFAGLEPRCVLLCVPDKPHPCSPDLRPDTGRVDRRRPLVDVFPGSGVVTVLPNSGSCSLYSPPSHTHTCNELYPPEVLPGYRKKKKAGDRKLYWPFFFFFFVPMSRCTM